MIDFACKKFSIDEIIKCTLGLTRSDLKLVKELLKSDAGWITSEEISRNVRLDLSTVQRSVKKLYEKNILQRKQNNLEKGGYIFIYSLQDKEKIKDLIMGIITDWVKGVDEELRKL